MARTSAVKKKKPAKKSAPRETAASLDAKRQMWAVVLFALGLLLCAITFIEGDKLWRTLHSFLFGMFGMSAFFLAPLMIYIAIVSAKDKPRGSIWTRLWQLIALLLILSGIFTIFGAGLPGEENLAENIIALYQAGIQLKSGGLMSAVLALPLLGLFEKTGAAIIIILLGFVFLMLITGSTLMGLARLINAAKKPVDSLEEAYAGRVMEKNERPARPAAKAPAASDAPRFDIDVDISGDTVMSPEPVSLEGMAASAAKAAGGRAGAAGQDSPVEYIPVPEPPAEPPQNAAETFSHPLDGDILKAEQDADAGEIADRFVGGDDETPPWEEAPAPQTEPIAYPTATPPAAHPPQYSFPPSTLLKTGRAPSAADVSEEMKTNAQTLVDTLKSFGVQTRITDICRGPAVTRYELQPSAGVKISKITGLSDDIALNLATAGIRIEAPIPNKAAVGIEVPNKAVSMVVIRELIESKEFNISQNILGVALGRDIAGNIILADIGKMPHVLIAGSTGSGKSVCINSIIISLLYKYSPDEVKLLMVDPKVVELGIYNGIPHLLVPVVTDPKKAAGALGWAVSEMMNRYKTFAASAVKDLAGFNRLAATRDDLAPMPKIVIIIDELADLMMAAPNEVEDCICRLAQMARAAGMHLVIATQRPSVDVITGIIKANIPSRIAFAVSSQVDSRTILDIGGAEKLLGRGDMLFYPVGVAKPMRVQGCFVTESEVEAVVEFVKQSVGSDYDEGIMEGIERHAVSGKGDSRASDGDNDEDEMIPMAIECVVEAGQASTSQLQRRLKLGYARAARIIDQLEQKGIVGPFEGSKPRQVLISKEQWMERKLSGIEDSVLNQSAQPDSDS